MGNEERIQNMTLEDYQEKMMCERFLKHYLKLETLEKELILKSILLYLKLEMIGDLSHMRLNFLQLMFLSIKAGHDYPEFRVLEKIHSNRKLDPLYTLKFINQFEFVHAENEALWIPAGRIR